MNITDIQLNQNVCYGDIPRAKPAKVIGIYPEFKQAVKVRDSKGEITLTADLLRTPSEQETALDAHRKAQKEKKRVEKAEKVIEGLKPLVELWKAGLRTPTEIAAKMGIGKLTAGLKIKTAKKYQLIK